MLPPPSFKGRLMPGGGVTRTMPAAIPGTYRAYVSWRDRSGERHLSSAQIEFNGRFTDARLRLRLPEATLLCDMTFERPDRTRHAMPGTRITFFERPSGSLSCGRAPYGTAISDPRQIRTGVYDLVSLSTENIDDVPDIPRDIYVSSIRQGTRDVVAQGLQITKGENRLELVVRAGAGSIQGRVSHKDGRPVHDAAVVLVPEAKGRPLIAYRQGRTDQHGDFDLRGIIPGAYRIYAWSNIRPNEFMNPEFMKQFEGRGQLLQIAERQQASMNLFPLDEQ